MDGNAETLMESFNMLPDPEKHQVARQILRWVREADYSELTDDDLSRTASAIFAAYDDEESADA